MGNKQSSNQIYKQQQQQQQQQTKNHKISEEFIEKIRNMETFSKEEIQTMNQLSEEYRFNILLTYNEMIDYVNHFMSYDA